MKVEWWSVRRLLQQASGLVNKAVGLTAHLVEEARGNAIPSVVVVRGLRGIWSDGVVPYLLVCKF